MEDSPEFLIAFAKTLTVNLRSIVEKANSTAESLGDNSREFATTKVALSIATDASKIVEDIESLPQTSRDIDEALGRIKDLAKLERKAAERITEEAGNISADSDDKVRIAGGVIKIAGEAAKIAGEAAKTAGGIVGSAVGGSAKIAGLAAGITTDASEIAADTSERAAENATKTAAAIKQQAADIAKEVIDNKGLVIEGDIGDPAKIVQLAADIVTKTIRITASTTEIPDLARSIIAGAVDVVTEAANITRGVVESPANVFANVTRDASAGVLLGSAMPLSYIGENIINNIISEIFKKLANPNVVLKTAVDIFKRADDQVILDLIFGVTRRTFRALRPFLGRVPVVYEGIFSNNLNWEALEFILSERYKLMGFLIDLVDPAKLFTAGNSTDGKPSNGNGERNTYNELDFNMPMNRHAAICQLQRLAKSLAYLLKNESSALSLSDIRMDTTLENDYGGDVGSKLQGDNSSKERWFFINGIAGEPYWSRLACDKLGDTFKRNVTGVLNRSEGILWDLIECAGERDLENGQGLVKRTKSSEEAQKKLEAQLRNTLPQGDDIHADPIKVVVIAHSQGCLLLRLVLQKFVHEGKNLENLRVFTFGNPCYDWNFDVYAEHFANVKDFVANLGVLRNGARENYRGTIFKNKNWTGHLFGAQYSLDPQDYEGDHPEGSRLLACAGPETTMS
ncbi:hypothetical protein AnigIFM63326_001531 [Aspergillus niger]|nr:hypothetical protein AnigIFM63326_001531 [Aspergillus niger]